jgi:hypothetical protein
METKTVYFYLCAVLLVVTASYVGNRFNAAFEHKDKDDEIIRQYLLNDSPLYGYNRPKLWIHSKYEINARKWKDFQSRNTTDLNQPYIHLVVKTIIDHCGEDFNICLIDDDSFKTLLPQWDLEISTLAEPFRSHIREIGMMQLLHVYGGIVVPNSFVCAKSLLGLYEQGINGNRPFVCENINRTMSLAKQPKRRNYYPDINMMGAPKGDPIIKEFLAYLKMRNQSIHFSQEADFLGETANWATEAVNAGKMNLIRAELVGVKSQNQRAIQLEDLMEEETLYLSPNAYGLWVPREEILRRPKFEWYAALSSADVLKANVFLTKYIIACSLPHLKNPYYKQSAPRSVISI